MPVPYIIHTTRWRGRVCQVSTSSENGPQKTPKKAAFLNSFYSVKKFGVYYTVGRTKMSNTSKREKFRNRVLWLPFNRKWGLWNIWEKNVTKNPMGGLSAPDGNGQAIHQNVHPVEWVMCVKFGGPQLIGPQEILKKFKNVPRRLEKHKNIKTRPHISHINKIYIKTCGSVRRM